jgi:2-amino-4-hydroxy-6-hydroxymethyldihydropteridine diphosphokinase
VTTAYIGIGSNVGDRRGFCRGAVRSLAESTGVDVRATSSLYETSPVGGPPQRSFVNAVTKVDTELSPRGLLEACKRIEARMGREVSDIRWGPRVVDLDILLYGEEKVNERDLEIPHPHMATRRFVLIPLLEVDPDVTDPWGTPYSDSVEEAEGEVDLLEPFGS